MRLMFFPSPRPWRTASMCRAEALSWSYDCGSLPPARMSKYRARAGMLDDALSNWTFVTAVRHPIDLLISHAV